MKRWMLSVVMMFAGAKALAAAPHQEALEKLGAKVTVANGVVTQANVDASKFTEAEFKTLGQFESLKRLTIRGKALNDATLPLLAGLTELEEISSDQTALSDEGYKHFAQFKKLRSLALFHPSWDLKTFTGAGLGHLKALPKLEKLTFAGSTAGDAALEALGEVTQLKEFSTWHTMQTQAGNKHLLKLTNLTFLRIGQRLPKWGQSPAASFDESTIQLLAKMKSLKKLELFEVRLTAKGLEPLKELPELKDLKIHTADISETDVEAVRAMLKGVKIDFRPLTAEEREGTLVKKLKI